MKINRVHPYNYPKLNISNPEIKQYTHGEYLLIIENYPYKQVRTIRNIKLGETVSREVIFYHH